MQIPGIRKWSKGRRWVPLLLFLVAGVHCWVYYRAFRPDENVLAEVERHVCNDLEDLIEQAREYELPDIGQTTQAQWGQMEALPFIALRYDDKGKLLAWTSNRYVPSRELLAAQLADPADGLLVDGDMVFYVLKNRMETTAELRLIPLLFSFPVENAYLQSFTYLGRYNDLPWINTKSIVPLFNAFDSRNAVTVRDPDQRPLYLLKPASVDVFRVPDRVLALGLFLLDICLLFWGYYRWLRKPLPTRPFLRQALFLTPVLVLRFLLLYLSLPGQWVQLPLFSSFNLALDRINPSVGDLLLNSLLLVVVVRTLFPVTLPERWAGWIAGRAPRWALWPLATAVGVVAWVLVISFLQYLQPVVENSTLRYNLADLTHLSALSLCVYAALGFLLLSVFRVVRTGVEVAVRLAALQGYNLYWLLAGWGVQVFAITLLVGVLWSYGFAVYLFLALALLMVSRLDAQPLKRTTFTLTLLMLLALAGVVTHGLGVNTRRMTDQDMKRYAEKYDNQSDPALEISFAETVRNIQDDHSLWQPDSLLSNRRPSSLLVSQARLDELINRHLLNHYLAYDFQVFAFTPDGRRLDEQFEKPAIGFAPPKAVGESDNIERPRFVADKQSLTRYLYVSRFPVQTEQYGLLYLQVEFYPKANITGRLYPQLFLSESIRKKLQPPEGFEIAVYHEHKLIRKVGDSSFPTFYKDDEELERQVSRQGDRKYHYLIVNKHDNRLVVIRIEKEDAFTKLTAFSSLFYFYLVLYVLIWAVFGLRKQLRDFWQKQRHTLAFRIQFVLMALSLLPLLIIYLLTSPLLVNYFYDEARQNLRQNLIQVTNFLENEGLFLADINRPNSNYAPAVRELLYKVSNIVNNDMNIYDMRGQLYNTTTPIVYQSVFSGVMNPHAFAELSQGRRSSFVTTEQVGSLRYLSGYTGLFDAKLELRGFLNMPYLAQQDRLETQIQRLLAYLINVYVLLMFALALAGLFLSRSITRPLQVLKSRLDDTSLGLHNEPIDYHARDEIGGIIGSYNTMLGKLSDSEKKLARNERELAWREMARQVAHEIKNPLTPMKLSVQHLQRIAKTSEVKPEAVERISKTLITQIDSLTSIANTFSQFATMPTDVQDELLVGDVLNEVYSLYATSEEARLELRVPPEPLRVVADKNQLTRVLVNLIRNAIQAMQNPEGLIRLQARRDGQRVVISVQDHGPGVPLDIQGRIFEPNFSTKNSGMGLGLAIVKKIVESARGTIWFESEPGNGATFYVSYPLVSETPHDAVTSAEDPQ